MITSFEFYQQNSILFLFFIELTFRYLTTYETGFCKESAKKYTLIEIFQEIKIDIHYFDKGKLS